MFSYRREIDGLRALAVVPVIFFHAGFEAFSGGFVGVDVFFVISGYLITSIILAQRAGGAGFSLLNFYERRARRILPALFLVMAVCIPFAWLWLLPSDMKDFSQSLVAVSLFASNILFWKESGYFDTAAELKFVDSENQFCIQTSLVGNIIRTDFTLFDELVHRVDSDPEYFYTPWGGKCEFLQALASRVISEYKYFESNPE